jgi:hypothetical protein
MLVKLKNLQMTKVSLRLSINLKRRDEAVVELLNVRRSELNRRKKLKPKEYLFPTWASYTQTKSEMRFENDFFNPLQNLINVG